MKNVAACLYFICLVFLKIKELAYKPGSVFLLEGMPAIYLRPRSPWGSIVLPSDVLKFERAALKHRFT